MCWGYVFYTLRRARLYRPKRYSTRVNEEFELFVRCCRRQQCQLLRRPCFVQFKPVSTSDDAEFQPAGASRSALSRIPNGRKNYDRLGPPDDLAGIALESYYVELVVSTSNNDYTMLSSSLSSDTTTFTHYGLSESTSYSYTVTAKNLDGPSERSAILLHSPQPYHSRSPYRISDK